MHELQNKSWEKLKPPSGVTHTETMSKPEPKQNAVRAVLCVCVCVCVCGVYLTCVCRLLAMFFTSSDAVSRGSSWWNLSDSIPSSYTQTHTHSYWLDCEICCTQTSVWTHCYSVWSSALLQALRATAERRARYLGPARGGRDPGPEHQQTSDHHTHQELMKKSGRGHTYTTSPQKSTFHLSVSEQNQKTVDSEVSKVQNYQKWSLVLKVCLRLWTKLTTGNHTHTSVTWFLRLQYFDLCVSATVWFFPSETSLMTWMWNFLRDQNPVSLFSDETVQFVKQSVSWSLYSPRSETLCSPCGPRRLPGWRSPWWRSPPRTGRWGRRCDPPAAGGPGDRQVNISDRARFQFIDWEFKNSWFLRCRRHWRWWGPETAERARWWNHRWSETQTDASRRQITREASPQKQHGCF